MDYIIIIKMYISVLQDLQSLKIYHKIIFIVWIIAAINLHLKYTLLIHIMCDVFVINIRAVLT